MSQALNPQNFILPGDSIQRKTLGTDTVEVETLPSSLDLLLLTITKVEFNAVFQLLDPPQGQPKILRALIRNTVYYVGRYGHYTAILLASFGAGMGNAMNHLHEALQLFKCQLVINIGIAWGANPDKHKLGDVLVAKKVVNIDDVKRHQGKIIERSEIPQIDPRINAVVNTTEQFWEDQRYKVHIGLYVGSNMLLNDPAVKKSILDRYSEAI
jgi:nucleoside phosphorylase